MRRVQLTNSIPTKLARRAGKEASTVMAGINRMLVAVIRKALPPQGEGILRSSTPRQAGKTIRTSSR
jgi:hypothetical protein